MLQREALSRLLDPTMQARREVLALMATVAAIVLAAFVVYRSQQRKRVSAVKVWIENYLVARDHAKPLHLTVDCSNDELWPVLVAYDDKQTGIRHRMQFRCQGLPSAFSLTSEIEEVRLEPQLMTAGG
jgi:hypothetical protein